MRPPLISTDIADLPPLLSARRHLDDGLLPRLAVDVDVLALQLRDGRLGEIVPIRARRRLLDHAELLRDLRSLVERLLVHDPDALRVRPGERVDLVHLPRLVALQERRPLSEYGVHAVLRVVAAPDPPLERRGQELLRDRLVALVRDPLGGREDAV